MVTRFLALIGAGAHDQSVSYREETAAALRPHGFSQVVASDHLTLLTNDIASILKLGENSEAVIGKLFSGIDPPIRVRSLHAAAEHDIRMSRGARLVADYWGGYVALLQDARSGRIDIIRDPSAALPCYYIQNAQGVFVASDVDLLISAGLLVPEIDWPNLAGHLVADQLRPSGTCLAGVTELLGGFRLTIQSGRLTLEQLWSPWRFAGRDHQIHDEREAITGVRTAALGAIAGWASTFNHILLGVSGGLDSSIVAAGLARAGVGFSCVTMVTDDKRGDERDYARTLASYLDVPLFEEFERVGQVDLERSDAAHLPRPIARSFAQSGDAAQHRLAEQIGADGYFSGGGGDNVFCYMQSVLPIADRLMTEGLGLGVLQTATDISLLAQCSVWATLPGTARRAWIRKPDYRWRRNAAFLDMVVIERDANLQLHPWLIAPADGLPGKAAHIAWLMHIQNHLEGYGRERTLPAVWPLMAHPLVEHCLRVPTWMWCAGGRNRHIARRAFEGDLPDDIINRRSKGTPDGFVNQIFETNRAKIRKMLSGGLLAAHGLLDVEALLKTLTDTRPVSGPDYSRIMSLVDVEAWTRSWTDRRLTAAASR